MLDDSYSFLINSLLYTYTVAILRTFLASKVPFWYVVNHLYRTKMSKRKGGNENQRTKNSVKLVSLFTQSGKSLWKLNTHGSCENLLWENQKDLLPGENSLPEFLLVEQHCSILADNLVSCWTGSSSFACHKPTIPKAQGTLNLHLTPMATPPHSSFPALISFRLHFICVRCNGERVHFSPCV